MYDVVDEFTLLIEVVERFHCSGNGLWPFPDNPITIKKEYLDAVEDGFVEGCQALLESR